MQNYNPTECKINMPVMYAVANEDGKIDNGSIMSGHFASYDAHGYPFVFEDGGTSYTRTPQQIIKCSFAHPMDSHQQSIFVTNKMRETPISTFGKHEDITGFKSK